eukprot:2281599-Amphidinium_carterae.1
MFEQFVSPNFQAFYFLAGSGGPKNSPYLQSWAVMMSALMRPNCHQMSAVMRLMSLKQGHTSCSVFSMAMADPRSVWVW